MNWMNLYNNDVFMNKTLCQNFASKITKHMIKESKIFEDQMVKQQRLIFWKICFEGKIHSMERWRESKQLG